MRDLYLIDGYNVIFWVPGEYSTSDLESSRKKLMDRLQDYGAHRDVEIIVVFDGQGESKKVRIDTVTPLFHIVFTPRHMTADS
ncbi:MAG: NYN domain-containing protein, partial [Allisonella histaminiformans]